MSDSNTTILAIESSCDDTACAIVQNGSILANCIANQDLLHRQYGGVVPELASRAHQEKIVPVVSAALEQADVELSELSAIAFTRGPGLLGPLLVGVSFAKSIGQALNIPIIEVHHMRAHVAAHYIDDPMPTFPFLCLTVSGGHTQIVLVKDYLEMEVVGRTLDDAAGEAFDKAGKMMGLDYPAGPIIDQLAQSGQVLFHFPKPQVPELNFSFSGLKTAFKYFLNDEKAKNSLFIEKNRADLCASIQHAIVEILADKLLRATAQFALNQVAIAGGVSANTYLRQRSRQLADEMKWRLFLPKFEYCTDNAAMVGMIGYLKYQKQLFTDLDIAPLPRMSM